MWQVIYILVCTNIVIPKLTANVPTFETVLQQREFYDGKPALHRYKFHMAHAMGPSEACGLTSPTPGALKVTSYP